MIGFSLAAQAQTKIMEYKTQQTWSDSGKFLQAGLHPIGTDFLAVIINRDPNAGEPVEDQIIYILDLKKKSLATKIDMVGKGYYWLSPSATTSSFILNYFEGNVERVALYNFNKKTRSWSVAIDEQVDTGSSTSYSTPVLPGYFVNTVQGGDKLELHVFKY